MKQNLEKSEMLTGLFFDEQTLDYKNREFPQVNEIEKPFDSGQRINFLRDVVIKNISNPEWIKNALPAEVISLERLKDSSKKEMAEKKLQEGMKIFFCDIMKALGKNVAI